MALDLPAGSRPLTGGFVDAWLRNMIAGAVCAIVSLAFSLSYAALIFSGPLTPYLAYGIAATFISAAIGAIVMAWRSSLPFAFASPDASTSAVVAALVAALASRLAAEGAGEHLLASTLIVLSLSSALTGLVLCGLGIARAGRAVRFVPYPVIGGFLGAAGWLIAAGAIQIITGYRLRLSGIENFFDGLTLAKFAAGACVAVVLLFGKQAFKGPLAQPGLLLACAAAVYAGLALFGISLTQAQADGWMFQPPSAAAISPPWDLDEWRRFPWHLLPALSADLIAVMFVATVSILLNVAGLEVTAKREADLDRELATAGISNLAAAAFGGYVTGVPLSRSTLAFKLAGNSRIPTLWVAASSAAMLGISPGFLAYIPKCVLGGLLLSLGLDLLYRWLIASSRQLSRIEYFSLVAITLMIINWDFVAGILVGIVISCATFALSASRVSAIKFSFDGSEYRSSLDRGPKELALLAQHGRELQGMSLQSYLFFGSANQLYQHIKQLLVSRPECRHLLFDFRLVTGIDSSATHSFTQIKQVVDKSGARLVLVNLSPAMTNAFRAIGFLSKDIVIGSDLDRALESCEDAIIAAHRTNEGAARSLRDWLAEELDTPQYADALAEQCRRIEFGPGDIIARQGERSDSMHFILEGRVGVIVEGGGGRRIRVRSLGQHTTIGEMGLITRRPRSATIEAEVASVLYELSAEAYERIKIDNPALSRALLAYVIRVMAERLSFASRVIGVLQR
ncbi:MAG TPA: SulP family inorganic anion transporter [Xanthobacteraceae bacterium]|nr:SulP family inorganic anion transporter [Xanthobacteraceae bacterium]